MRMRSSDAGRSAIGTALKFWRSRRRLSQLELAMCADVSARHIAFLETGRANPSREMIVSLSEALAVPLRDRNALLHAAGFAPVYIARPLTDAALAPVRAAYEMLLDKHEPYPAILFDRHWTLVRSNRAAKAALALPGEPLNLVRLLAGNPATPQLIVNWGEVAHDMLDRLRLEARSTSGDPVLEELTALLQADPVFKSTTSPRRPPGSLFADVRIKTAHGEVCLFSTIAEFGTIDEITVRDLRIELFFPSDDHSRQVLIELSAL